MAARTILKQPAEILREIVSFAGPIAIVSPIGVVGRGLVAGAGVLAAVAIGPVTDGVTLALSGGTDGERYLVTVRAELQDGEVAEAELEVAVVDAAWVMPDGGAPYLSIAEFVQRFGLPETVVMTDPDGSGRIDRSYLVAALQAAQGIADLYLAARYATPIAAVPEAVKTAIGDLARARLYPRGAPEGVAGQARSAEAMLVKISEGKLPLPLPAGGTVAAETTATPILISNRGRRAYPNGLDDLR